MLDIEPLSNALGAEVVGLDLAAPLDSATVATLGAALLDRLVPLFGGQTMEERVRFAAWFGEPGGSRLTRQAATPALSATSARTAGRTARCRMAN